MPMSVLSGSSSGNRSQMDDALTASNILVPSDTSREYYVYTFQRAGGDIEEQRIIVYYDDDQFSHYEAQLLEETPAY